MITREMIAGAIRGAGLTNSELSTLTKSREKHGLGQYVSADAISLFLKRGYPGSDLGYLKVASLVSALAAEGVEFRNDGSIKIPEGLLAKRRSLEK